MLNKKLSLNAFIFILAIIAGIEVIGLFCYSTPPPQQTNQNQTKQENYGTGPAVPLSFFMPLVTNTKQGLHCIADWIDTNSDIVMALSTIAIALFTFTLWQTSQDHSRHMEASIIVAKDTAEAAQKAADAAKKTADSFQALERARIYVEVEHIQKGKLKMIEGIQDGSNEIRVVIVNEGNSLATITKFNWYVVAIDDVEIKSKIAELESLQTSMIPVITIRGNDAVKRIFRFEMNKFDVQRVNTFTAHYYCLGYIKYKDVFRGVRPITFCWKDEGSYFSRDPEYSTDA